MKYSTEAGIVIAIAAILAGGIIWYINTAMYPTPSVYKAPLATTSLAVASPATTTVPAQEPVQASPAKQPIGTTTPPEIISFQPSSATVGSTITITGTGFSYVSNNIMFGISLDRHHPDGTADNLVATEASLDGKTLRFTVPATGPSGELCVTKDQCVAVIGTPTTPGNYAVSVSNGSSMSTTSIFMVIAKN